MKCEVSWIASLELRDFSQYVSINAVQRGNDASVLGAMGRRLDGWE